MPDSLPPALRISEQSATEISHAFELNIAEAFLRAVPDHREALEMLGHALTRAGRHVEALEADRRLAELQPGNAYVRYNLACSYSNLKMVDDALRELERALEFGYDDIAFLEADPDLAAVRKDGRYRKLLERARRGRTGR